MDDYRRANLNLWNEWTRIHEKSAFYDVEGFKAGRDTLLPPERAELGDVRGLRLLHLQCHFGMDTLSLARRGAQVVGVDFSDEAVKLARRLAAETGLPASFVQSDIYDLAEHRPADWQDAFDLVYVTYGAIEWLGDLRAWAGLIEWSLRPGGRLYLAELHPFALMLELEEAGDGESAVAFSSPEPARANRSADTTAETAAGLPAVDGATTGPGLAGATTEPGAAGAASAYRLYQTYGYFPRPEPDRFPVEGSYADRDAVVEQDHCYGWTHAISEVVGVLLERGLVLQHLHEFPYSCSPFWPQMQNLDGDGLYWLLDSEGNRRTDVPFLYSLSAEKPATA